MFGSHWDLVFRCGNGPVSCAHGPGRPWRSMVYQLGRATRNGRQGHVDANCLDQSVCLLHEPLQVWTSLAGTALILGYDMRIVALSSNNMCRNDHHKNKCPLLARNPTNDTHSSCHHCRRPLSMKKWRRQVHTTNRVVNTPLRTTVEPCVNQKQKKARCMDFCNNIASSLYF